MLPDTKRVPHPSRVPCESAGPLADIASAHWGMPHAFATHKAGALSFSRSVREGGAFRHHAPTVILRKRRPANEGSLHFAGTTTNEGCPILARSLR